MMDKRNSAGFEHPRKLTNIAGNCIGLSVNEGIKREREVDRRVVYHWKHKPVVDLKLEIRVASKALLALLNTRRRQINPD